jgi:hypothetical protein
VMLTRKPSDTVTSSARRGARNPINPGMTRRFDPSAADAELDGFWNRGALGPLPRSLRQRTG